MLVDTGFNLTLSEQYTFVTNVFAMAGEDPSNNIGDFNVIDNNAALDTVRLYRMYLNATFPTLELHIGKLAVDDEFMLSDFSDLFINSAFGILPTVSGNVPIPNYPLTAPGVFVRKTFAGKNHLQFGAYDGNTQDERSNKHGLNNAIRDNEGLAYFGELALIENSYSLKLGGFVHTGEFQNYKSSTTEDINTSLYFGLDYVPAFFTGSEAIGMFVRGGYSPDESINIVNFYMDAGMVFLSPFEKRTDDEIGIAISYTDFSSDYVLAERRNGSIQKDYELVLELTWNILISEKIHLIPDFQYIHSPANSNRDASVVGMRIEMEL